MVWGRHGPQFSAFAAAVSPRCATPAGGSDSEWTPEDGEDGEGDASPALPKRAKRGGAGSRPGSRASGAAPPPLGRGMLACMTKKASIRGKKRESTLDIFTDVDGAGWPPAIAAAAAFAPIAHSL